MAKANDRKIYEVLVIISWGSGRMAGGCGAHLVENGDKCGCVVVTKDHIQHFWNKSRRKKGAKYRLVSRLECKHKKFGKCFWISGDDSDPKKEWVGGMNTLCREYRTKK